MNHEVAKETVRIWIEEWAAGGTARTTADRLGIKTYALYQRRHRLRKESGIDLPSFARSAVGGRHLNEDEAKELRELVEKAKSRRRPRRATPKDGAE